MKKMLVLLLAFAMTISLVACGKETVTPTQTDVTTSNESFTISNESTAAENDVIPSQESTIASSQIPSNNKQNTSSKVNPSTNITSVVSQPNNVEKTENSPPESNDTPISTSKSFSTINELKSWLNDSKSLSEENGVYKEAINDIKSLGVLTPITSHKIYSISLITSKLYNSKGDTVYVYSNVSNDFSNLQIQVSLPNEVEKQYMSKGIAKYYTDVKNTVFGEEAYGDDGEVVSKVSKGILPLANNSYECVIADTDRGRECNRSYIIFLNGYRVSISLRYKGDIDTDLNFTDITKQISLNLESLK